MDVVELRQYTMRPGRRDDLVDLFDREFIEPQEAAGARVIGQFRDQRDPDRFVWLRGFADMDTRAAALADFYGGPVWRAHRDAANDTMLDSDDVLLLRPVGAAGGFDLAPRRFEPTRSVVAATVYHRDEPVDDEFVGFFDDIVAPFMAGLGAPPVATFATLAARNNFPALPVRTRARVFVWFSVFADDFDARVHERALRSSREWHDGLLPELLSKIKLPYDRLALLPTARSQLR
jgi:hypothetical protein